MLSKVHAHIAYNIHLEISRKSKVSHYSTSTTETQTTLSFPMSTPPAIAAPPKNTMDSSVAESSSHKRKRTPSAEDSGRASAPPPAPAPAMPSIDYLSKAKANRLHLIDADAGMFAGVLSQLEDYEGVLQRRESLAGNLGANLLAPMMLRGLEKTFDAPPKVITASFDVEQSPITWLDVVTFASANPDQFVLSESDGSVSCRCWIRGARIEITKDDHRLIKSGLPKNLIPVQPLADDESAELETIHILEARLQSLIKQSDGVAGKARQLNYHLKGRKNALVAKKADSLGNVDVESRTYSPQAFPAVNARSSQGPNGEANKLQSELLTHYRSLDERSSASHDRRTSLPPGRDSRPKPGRMSTSDGFKTDSPDVRRNSQPNTSSEDGSDRRAIMAARIERLNRGDPIQPKCDRCRRLKFECTKHLTACQACTKKHAKCSWRDVTDEELETGPHASMVAPPPSQRPTASAGNGYLPAEVTSQPRATSSINSYNSAENTSRLPTTSAEEADFVPQASMSASRHPSSAHTHFSSADSSLFAQSGPRTAAPRQPILNDRWKKLQDLQAEMETDE